MIRVGISGATGRMGRRVLGEVEAAPDLTVAWAAGRAPPADPNDADVVVDFSTPEGLRRLLEVARVPVVTGTTGISGLPDSPAIPLLHAANFSPGVAVLVQLAREASRLLPGYDVEIVEIHHAGKRDAPSGTALRLGEALRIGRAEADGDGLPATVVSGRSGPRVPGEIGMHAVRGGDTIGEHTVYLCGPGERVQLGHVATDRGLFAAGAVRCARWIVGKPPGRYRLEDALGVVRA